MTVYNMKISSDASVTRRRANDSVLLFNVETVNAIATGVSNIASGLFFWIIVLKIKKKYNVLLLFIYDCLYLHYIHYST